MSSKIVHKIPENPNNSNLNPELEKLRNEVLDTKQEEEKTAKDLATQLASVHAAYLFVGCGELALSEICKVVSSTPACSTTAATSSWKDLASHLGLTFHQICCIENYKYSDCTEIVLKTFAQKMDATLDKIVMALYDLKRYDAISMARPHLQGLGKHARREQVARTEEEDSGYYSIDGLESEGGTYDGILRPSGLRHLRSQLHITLKSFDTSKSEEISTLNESVKIEENLQQANLITRSNGSNRNKCSKRVMLTFAEDGQKIAYEIAAKFRKARGNYLPIGVLILDEHIDLVSANPEQFIIHYFPKVDYIIPILTPKYIGSLDKTPSPEDCSSSAIDTQYVQMIYTLMNKYYVGNLCRNDKFRCIIPDQYVNSVLNNNRMKRELVFQAYVTESKLDSLLLRILKKK